MTILKTAKRIVGSVAILMLAACSSVDDKASQPAELVDFDAEVVIKRVWSRGIGGPDNKYLTGPRPVFWNGVVYAATGNGNVVAVDAEKGKRLWKAKLNKGLSGGVGIGGSKVYVGDLEGRLFALNAADGIQQWQVQLSSEILSSASGNDDKVAIQTKDGWVYLLDANNGEEIWKYQSQSNKTLLTNYGTSSPLLVKGMVIVASADGKVTSLDVDRGSLVWEQRVATPRGRSELDKLSDIDGEMVFKGDVLYVSSYQGSAMAFSRRGRPIWEQKSSSFHGPAVAGSRLYLVEERDNIRALRGNGGQQLWENDQLRLRKLTAPVAIGNYVAVADNDGYLHVLDGSDGRFVGRKKVDGSGVRVPIASDGEVLYVQDHDGTLSAYRIIAKDK